MNDSLNIANVEFVEGLYEQFLRDPHAPDHAWAAYERLIRSLQT